MVLQWLFTHRWAPSYICILGYSNKKVEEPGITPSMDKTTDDLGLHCLWVALVYQVDLNPYILLPCTIFFPLESQHGLISSGNVDQAQSSGSDWIKLSYTMTQASPYSFAIISLSTCKEIAHQSNIVCGLGSCHQFYSPTLDWDDLFLKKRLIYVHNDPWMTFHLIRVLAKSYHH